MSFVQSFFAMFFRFSVNLEHNNLTSFSGLVHLRFLRVLCLNHNHVECVTSRPKNQKPQVSLKVCSFTCDDGKITTIKNDTVPALYCLR